jgi:hypothetical protein
VGPMLIASAVGDRSVLWRQKWSWRRLAILSFVSCERLYLTRCKL